MVLDTVAFAAHLKKYHNNFVKPIVILANLYKVLWIHETILKNPLATIVASKKKQKKTHKIIVSTTDLDVLEDETLLDDELDSQLRVKAKTLKPLPKGNFEVVQLNHNPLILVHRGADFSIPSEERVH